MAKFPIGRKVSASFNDVCLFFGGALLAVFMVWSFASFVVSRNSSSSPLSWPRVSIGRRTADSPLDCAFGLGRENGPRGPMADPAERSFFDEPGISYSIEKPMIDWDGKRKEWLRQHPSYIQGLHNRVLMITGSQPSPCENLIGDHLLLRLFKNKVDYCRIHRCEVFYNNALLHPKMTGYWAKYAVVRAAMLAHPEVEWIWWVDSDAMITDMEFKLPLDRYQAYNLVVPGWPNLVFGAKKKSWTSINAGIFLIRNCQWSMDFLDQWASAGPQTHEYENWGQILRSAFEDKLYPNSDDQSALLYLILKHQGNKFGDKIRIESEYTLHGYWLGIVGELDNLTESYREMEKWVPGLRRRHAEAVSEYYGLEREKHRRKKADKKGGGGRGRRPFITHFTGCEPCSGEHNPEYRAENCWQGMVKALNFADNQVLRNYGFMRHDLTNTSDVSAVPFDYPADEDVGGKDDQQPKL